MRKVATPDTGKATTPRQEGGSSTWHKEGGNSTWHEEGGNSTWHEEGGNSTWHDEEGNSPWRRQLHMTWMTYNSTWHQSMKPHGTKEAAALHGKRRCNLRPRQNATPHKQDTDSTWCRGAEHKSTHTQPKKTKSTTAGTKQEHDNFSLGNRMQVFAAALLYCFSIFIYIFMLVAI